MRWVLLDTETSGIHPPMHCLELAAQRMNGWEPEGPPFRRILNHNVDIPPEASRVNGFTREILERDGDDPRTVHHEFAQYAGDLPLVSYNLTFDLDQVLRPEWERLGLSPVGEAGFCALRLAQRLLDPVPAGNCKLQTLRQYFRLPERGAHTALGDVQTVIDLLQTALRPEAVRRGLQSIEALRAFANETWFPSRLAFGKFKGRHFTEARQDADLRGWLEWLAASENPRSAEMGRWYLRALEQPVDVEPKALLCESPGGGLVVYSDPETSELRRLIEAARARLAALQAEYSRERHAVEAVQAQLFELLRATYKRRDDLLLVVRHRRRYLEMLMQEGEEAAAETAEQYRREQRACDEEYEQASEAATRKRRDLSSEQQEELKRIWRKLVRLFHPDRYRDDPERQAAYERLTAEINRAREEGDLDRLREIAEDPDGFLKRQGLAPLDFQDDEDASQLRELYQSLQGQILDVIDIIASLRASAEHELYRDASRDPDFLHRLAKLHAERLEVEITELERETDALAAEIETLAGAPPRVVT